MTSALARRAGSEPAPIKSPVEADPSGRRTKPEIDVERAAARIRRARGRLERLGSRLEVIEGQLHSEPESAGFETPSTPHHDEDVRRGRIGAVAGDADAAFRRGRSLIDRASPRLGDKTATEAADWLSRAIAGGHSKARRELARLTRRRVLWAEVASGDPGACYRLGKALLEGDLLDEDYASALDWFRRAAEGEHTEARYEFARLVLETNSVSDRRRVALDHLCAAARRGSMGALDLLVEESTDDADAAFLLSVYDLEQTGASCDVERGLESLSRAAEEGQLDAVFNLGCAHLVGNHLARDETAALECFRRAAEAGDARASFNVGAMHLEGIGTNIDLCTAVDWFRRAARQGDPRAQEVASRVFMGGKESGIFLQPRP